jgi:hypothetical protein
VDGTTSSSGFPTQGPYQSSNAGGSDAFVAKLVGGLSPPVFTGISTDSGTSSSDRITTDQTLSFSGTNQGSTAVQLFRRGVGPIGSTSMTTGTWTFDYTELEQYAQTRVGQKIAG